jgi:hypothetical protein
MTNLVPKEFILPVVGAVLGTFAILGAMVVCIFCCTRPRREPRVMVDPKSRNTSTRRPKDVVQRDTSIVSAVDSVPVPLTPSFRRSRSIGAQSSIYENFGRSPNGRNSYPVNDDFSDVWSYAMVRPQRSRWKGSWYYPRTDSLHLFGVLDVYVRPKMKADLWLVNCQGEMTRAAWKMKRMMMERNTVLKSHIREQILLRPRYLLELVQEDRCTKCSV